MRTVDDILFEVAGQTLAFDAPEGRPTELVSVTVHRWDAGDGTLEDAVASSAIAAAPVTATTARAGAGELDPRTIAVTAIAGFSVEQILEIVGDTGLREQLEVLEVDDDDAPAGAIVARHPLHNAYESGAAIHSTRIVATLSDEWTSDEAKLLDAPGPNPMYRVRWVYKVGAATRVADTYFNLVRYGGRHGVTPQNVDDLVPGWMNSLPPDHYRNQGRSLIDDAYRAVKLDLHGVDFDDAAIAEAEVIDELTRYKTVELGEWAKLIAGGGDVERHRAAEDKYTRRLDSLLRIVARVPVRDSTGAAGPAPYPSLTRR